MKVCGQFLLSYHKSLGIFWEVKVFVVVLLLVNIFEDRAILHDLIIITLILGRVRIILNNTNVIRVNGGLVSLRILDANDPAIIDILLAIDVISVKFIAKSH